MGYWKEKQIEWHERGYVDSEILICSECINDYFLKNFIQTSGKLNECHYCKNEKKCVSLPQLMEIIMKGICQDYEVANGNVAYESKEGGYIGALVWDNDDLIYDILQDDMIVSEEIAEDIKEIMLEETWCERDPYGDRPDDEIYYSWKNFAQGLMENEEADVLNRYDVILDEVGEMILEHHLITNIEVDTPIYRARFHDKNETIQKSSQLASPKPESASNNRMSKQGYPMFYGSFCKEVCILEVGETEDLSISIGAFLNQEELKLIDFTKVEEIQYISCFDIERYKERVSLSFLRKFNEDISKPIEKLDQIQKEYIPTQVLTNYFKNNLKAENGKLIDGIIYDSSIFKSGKCVVLFLKNEDASDKKDKTLWLDNQSIETYNYSDYIFMKKSLEIKN